MDFFLLSGETICELEDIKTSSRKTEEIRFAARRAVHFLDENQERYKVFIWDSGACAYLTAAELEDNPDNRIISCAAEAFNYYPGLVFCSDDILCRLIAKEYFGLEVLSVEIEEPEKYSGFIEKILTDEEQDYFYSNPDENVYNLLTNQYLVIRNTENEIIDTYRWTGNHYDSIFKKQLRSLSFGDKLKPKDIYQQITIDSIMKNTMTAISGKAGSGKTLISLMSAMYLVDSGKYDRLVILYNPIKVRGSESQGFYPGTSDEKALQSSIGQILTTKFGDRLGVELLINQDKLKLVCMADCRGMEIRDNEILLVSETENTSIDLIKICLSRVSSGAKVIIEGDYDQIDSVLFMGSRNGLKRVIDVFKGQPEFGYVELQNVWRSRIAELCDLL